MLHVNGTCGTVSTEQCDPKSGETGSGLCACDMTSDDRNLRYAFDIEERKCVLQNECNGNKRYLTHDGQYCVANCYTEDYSGDGDRYAVGLDRKACQPIAYSETDKQYYCVDASSKQPLQGTNSVDIQNEAVCECL